MQRRTSSCTGISGMTAGKVSFPAGKLRGETKGKEGDSHEIVYHAKDAFVYSDAGDSRPCRRHAVQLQRGAHGLNNQIGEELQLVLSGQKNELTNTVALLGTTMDNFGRDAEVVEYLRGKSDPTLMSLGESARLERHLQESIDLLSKEYALLRDVGLADISGTVLLHSTASFVGSNIADREYFQAALRDEVRPTTIESKANGLLSSALGLPVKDGDRIVGVVYGTLDLGKMADSTTDTVHIARTGKCFVYDKTGRLLMHPNKDYIGDDDSGLPWVEHMLTSPAGRYDYEWNGSDMLGYFDRVPMVDWLIIVSVEESDIHAPVSAMFRQSLLVGGLAMLIVGLVIVLVARGIAGTLKAMAVLVEKLAGGDLSLTELEGAVHVPRRGSRR